MKDKEVIKYELDRVKRIVYDPASAMNYDRESLQCLEMKMRTLEWVLEVNPPFHTPRSGARQGGEKQNHRPCDLA